MVTSPREFFDELKAQPSIPQFAGEHGTFDFVLDNREHWRMQVDDGHVTKVDLSEAPSQQTDCIVASSKEDFIGIVNGERNLFTYALRGRVKFSGDLTLVLNFQKLVRLRKAQPARGGKP